MNQYKTCTHLKCVNFRWKLDFPEIWKISIFRDSHYRFCPKFYNLTEIKKKWETETSNLNQRSKPKIQKTGLSQGNTKNKDKTAHKTKKVHKEGHHGPIKTRVRPGVPAEWASTASLETPAMMAMVKSGAEGRTKLYIRTRVKTSSLTQNTHNFAFPTFCIALYVIVF